VCTSDAGRLSYKETTLQVCTSDAGRLSYKETTL